MIPFGKKWFVVALLLATSGGQRRRFSNNKSRLDLLKKIVQTTEEDNSNILGRIGDRRPTSILDRVRNRPNRPNRPSFDPLKRTNNRRPFSPQITSGKLRNSLSDNECEDLKNENDILKQLVESVNKQRAEEAKAAITQQEQLAQVNQPNPLSVLSEALKISLGLAPTPPLPQAVPGVHDRGIRRVNTKPETSTVFQTTSYQTHLTSEVTKDISLLFQGKWKTTQIVESVIETSTVTEILTSVITATPSVTNPQILNTLEHNLRKEKERPKSNGRFRPSLPRRPTQVKIKPFKPQRPQFGRPKSQTQNLESFQTLKSYLKNIKQNQTPGPVKLPSLHRPRKYSVDKSEEEPVSRRAGLFGSKNLLKAKINNSKNKLKEITEPSTPAPPPPPPEPKPLPSPQQSDSKSDATATKDNAVESTSIVTVYLSGKVPGVYSTSLKTVIVEASRAKRSADLVIQPTKTIPLDEESVDHSYWNLILDSSFEENSAPACTQQTVTVTVTETVGCQL